MHPEKPSYSPAASRAVRRIALRPALWLTSALVTAATLGAVHGCGSSEPRSGFADPPATPVDAGTPDTTTTTKPPIADAQAADSDIFASGPYTDFPAAIVDAPDAGVAAPANAGALFDAADAGASDAATSAGPCLVEPEIGSLYPRNWLRPRFRWIPVAGETLFELRLHISNQTQDLLVYTSASSWTMPKAMWDAVRQHSNDLPVTVTIRGGVLTGATLSNVAVGSTGDIGIAPVDAPGTIVYWTTTGVSQLKGFSVGDESVAPVLVPSQVQMRGTGNVQCVGCHASTPDGKSVGFGVGPNGYTNAMATIEVDAGVGAVPSYVSPLAASQLNLLHGIPAYSKGHWAAGDRVVLLSDTGALTWVDLEATDAGAVRGTVLRTGDPAKSVAPTWSHDGTTVVYGSTTGDIIDGRPAKGPSDIWSVLYGNRAGGTATKVASASDPQYDEYYPAFSPDDKLIVYNRVPSGTDQYNAPKAEVFVASPTGAALSATRLTANDPPACGGKKSPGVTNSWPKWSPEATTYKGRTFYWIVFSTTRDGASPQLYVAPVVVDAAGMLTSYRALYLWNQPPAEANHTPAWDTFKIPPPDAPR